MIIRITEPIMKITPNKPAIETIAISRSITFSSMLILINIANRK